MKMSDIKNNYKNNDCAHKITASERAGDGGGGVGRSGENLKRKRKNIMSSNVN